MAEFWGKNSLLVIFSLTVISAMILNLLLSCLIVYQIQVREDGLKSSTSLQGKHQVRVQGVLSVQDSLVTAKIAAEEEGLHLQSPVGIRLSASAPPAAAVSTSGSGTNLLIGRDFILSADEVNIESKSGNGGVKLKNGTVFINSTQQSIKGISSSLDSLRSKSIKSPPNEGLRFQSSTARLHLHAAEDIDFKSRAGSITTYNALNVTVTSADKIILSGANVYIQGLSSARPSQSEKGGHELCVCGSGKLFVSSGSSAGCSAAAAASC